MTNGSMRGAYYIGNSSFLIAFQMTQGQNLVCSQCYPPSNVFFRLINVNLFSKKECLRPIESRPIISEVYSTEIEKEKLFLTAKLNQRFSLSSPA